MKEKTLPLSKTEIKDLDKLFEVIAYDFRIHRITESILKLKVKNYTNEVIFVEVRYGTDNFKETVIVDRKKMKVIE